MEVDVLYSRNTIYNFNKNLKKFIKFLFEYEYIKPFIINKDVLTPAEVKEVIIFSPEDYDKVFNNLDIKKKNTNFKNPYIPSRLFRLTRK